MVFQSVFGVVNSTRLLPKPKLCFKKMKKEITTSISVVLYLQLAAKVHILNFLSLFFLFIFLPCNLNAASTLLGTPDQSFRMSLGKPGSILLLCSSYLIIQIYKVEIYEKH